VSAEIARLQDFPYHVGAILHGGWQSHGLILVEALGVNWLPDIKLFTSRLLTNVLDVANRLTIGWEWISVRTRACNNNQQDMSGRPIVCAQEHVPHLQPRNWPEGCCVWSDTSGTPPCLISWLAPHRISAKDSLCFRLRTTSLGSTSTAAPSRRHVVRAGSICADASVCT